MRLLLICSVALLTGIAKQSNANEAAKTTVPELLYLHCFSQTTGQRVVTDPETAKDSKPPTPPRRLVTLKVDVGRGFEVISSSMHRVSGQIKRDDDSYIADLQGAFGSGFKYSGQVKLDEVFDPEVTWFSGAVFPCRCVFSKEKDITPFLNAQAEADAEKLREATERTRRNDELQRKREAEQGGPDEPAANPSARVKAVIEANTNEGSRRAALQALADDYGRAGFDPSVAFLQALPADDSSRGAFHTITHHITIAEPARCLAVFTSLYDAFPDGWIGSALSNTAMTWGAKDPGAAFDAYRDFDGFKFPAERQEYLGEILVILHKVDPALAMKKIEQLSQPQLQATLKGLVETSSK